MFTRILAAILRPFIYLFHPWRVKGRENLPAQGGVILVSNHLSNWDPPLLFLLCQPRRLCFMAKAELFRFKPFGKLISGLFGAFPVERGSGDSDAMGAAQRVVEKGELLGIFPEGRRSDGTQLLRFKSGASLVAQRTGVSIVPCGIDRRSRLFRRVTVTLGEPLTPQELHLTGDNPNTHHANRMLAERVSALSGLEPAP